MATPNSEQQAALELHNHARAEVNNAPLRWHKICADAAAAHAQVLAQADNGMRHAEQPGDDSAQGENIACGRGLGLLEAAQLWFDEKPSWKGEAVTAESKGSKEEKHYTQVGDGGAR